MGTWKNIYTETILIFSFFSENHVTQCMYIRHCNSLQSIISVQVSIGVTSIYLISGTAAAAATKGALLLLSLLRRRSRCDGTGATNPVLQNDCCCCWTATHVREYTLIHVYILPVQRRITSSFKPLCRIESDPAAAMNPVLQNHHRWTAATESHIHVRAYIELHAIVPLQAIRLRSSRCAESKVNPYCEQTRLFVHSIWKYYDVVLFWDLFMN